MRVFLFEFVVGGGFLSVPNSPQPDGSLLTEGLAMWKAVYEDLVALPHVELATTWDARLQRTYDRGVIEVGDSIGSTFAELAQWADVGLLIAPEFDDHLLKITELLEAKPCVLASPNSRFVRIASDKTKTVELCQLAGLPVPNGVRLEVGEQAPTDFPFPAVLKRNDGAGSMGQILHAPLRQSFIDVMRLERLVPGKPCSVSFFCRGCDPPIACPPMEQLLSGDEKLEYLGGRRIMDAEDAERATNLGTNVIAAMPATNGYVGVDLILGPTAADDCVIEVNPRLTTSYVGLRSIAQTNLAAAMLSTAAGSRPKIEFTDSPVRFDINGTCNAE